MRCTRAILGITSGTSRVCCACQLSRKSQQFPMRTYWPIKDSDAANDTWPQVGGRKRAVFGGSSGPSDYGTGSGEKEESPIRCIAKLERKARCRAEIGKNMRASVVSYSTGTPSKLSELGGCPRELPIAPQVFTRFAVFLSSCPVPIPHVVVVPGEVPGIVS